MSDDISRQIFKEEAFELLAELETTLLELEENPEAVNIVNRVFRALHTIKGSGAMFGFDAISDFTHEVESVFDMVRNGDLRVDHALLNQAFAARDHLLRMMEEGGGEEVDKEEAATILVELRRIAAGEAESVASECSTEVEESWPDEADWADGSGMDSEPEKEALSPEKRLLLVRIVPGREVAARNLPIEFLLDELTKLGTCEVRANETSLPALEQLDPEKMYLSWDILLETDRDESDVLDIFFFSDVPLDVEIRPWGKGEDFSLLAPPEDVGEEGNCKPREQLQSYTEMPFEDSAELLQLSAPEPEQDGEIASEPVASLPQTDRDSPVRPEPGPIEQAKPTQHAVAPDVIGPSRGPDSGSSIRVAADKLDSLVDLVGELVIVQAQISQLAIDQDDKELKRLSEDLERLSDELRDSALGVRMLPIGTTFSKFRRLVRDLASELGKEIELTTSGADTELDKTVMERLTDPLVHLLRNSIDHGVELPEERLKEGKPRQATIMLSAEHSGGEVLIRITDDGRGMSTEAIRQKAVERGLLLPEAELSQSELLNMIFEPGFSTAKQITSVSGRGVGMDVVKRAIDSLRGRIVIDSEQGKGTGITIRLPLTLAIIDGLQTRVGNEDYVVPLSLVEECVELRVEDEADNQRILYLRGEIVPYLQLRDWFDIPGERPLIEQVVIVGLEGRRVGIVVDKVIGEHQTVIKSLSKVYKDVVGISGATIKGDGSIALILDVPGLMRRVMADTA
ncbi:MAG: chemotaxis protein CheA [Desulfovibrionaceae bacterium]